MRWRTLPKPEIHGHVRLRLGFVTRQTLRATIFIACSQSLPHFQVAVLPWETMDPTTFASEVQSLAKARSATGCRQLRDHQQDPGRSMQDAVSMLNNTPRIGKQKVQSWNGSRSDGAAGNDHALGTPESLPSLNPLATRSRPKRPSKGESAPRSYEMVALQLLDLLDMTRQDRLLLEAVIPPKRVQSSPIPSSNGPTSNHEKSDHHLAGCQHIVPGIQDHYLAYELHGRHDERRRMSDLAAQELDLWNISGA